MDIPREYTVLKFFQYGHNTKHNKYNDSYQAGCPVCREGKSLGKKQRCYYIPANDIIYCHNCGWSSKSIKWIKEVGSLTYDEILEEARDFDIDVDKYLKTRENVESRRVVKTLPDDCINLFDPSQVKFYSDNKVIQQALQVIKGRYIDTAVNRPKGIFVSLSDFVHKNRLIIPFYDNSEKIIFYQSRSIMDDSLPKYLSKTDGIKSLYGFNNIDPSLEYIFLFEGPINSFFCRNGVAVAGIQEKSTTSFTNVQQSQLQELPLYKRIWVLDSQQKDRASRLKSNILADLGENIFVWPRGLGNKYKDFNDIAIDLKINELPTKYIVDNSFRGMGAKIAISAEA